MHAANQASHCYEGEDILAKEAMSLEPSANQKYQGQSHLSHFIFHLYLVGGRLAFNGLTWTVTVHCTHLQLKLDSSD